MQHARRLAVDGLAETRKAVHALRDEPIALTEQLAALAATDGAQLTVTGTGAQANARCRTCPVPRRAGGR